MLTHEQRIERLRLSIYLSPTVDSLGIWLTKYRRQEERLTMPNSTRLSLRFIGDPTDPYSVLRASVNALLADQELGPLSLF